MNSENIIVPSAATIARLIVVAKRATRRQYPMNSENIIVPSAAAIAGLIVAAKRATRKLLVHSGYQYSRAHTISHMTWQTAVLKEMREIIAERDGISNKASDPTAAGPMSSEVAL